MITIEKGIPITPSIRSTISGEEVQKALETLDPGDSFALPLGMRGTLAVLIGTVGRKLGRNFTTRATEDSKVRCWRIQ